MSKEKDTGWYGRSLSNYISQHPKAKGASTLTEARQQVFGQKSKNFGCKCNQTNCARRNGGKSSHC